MTNNIRKRWWFLARLSITLGLFLGLFFGSGLSDKTGASFLLCIALIIFAWAYACTINMLCRDYDKVKRSRNKKY